MKNNLVKKNNPAINEFKKRGEKIRKPIKTSLKTDGQLL